MPYCWQGSGQRIPCAQIFNQTRVTQATQGRIAKWIQKFKTAGCVDVRHDKQCSQGWNIAEIHAMENLAEIQQQKFHL